MSQIVEADLSKTVFRKQLAERNIYTLDDPDCVEEMMEKIIITL